MLGQQQPKLTHFPGELLWDLNLGVVFHFKPCLASSSGTDHPVKELPLEKTAG